jgi:hypothetical protein
MPAEQSNQPAASTVKKNQGSSTTITPELVKEVAEKVYALMLRDLKISRERQRGNTNTYPHKGR